MADHPTDDGKRARILLFLAVFVFVMIYVKLNIKDLSSSLKLDELSFQVEDQFGSLGDLFKTEVAVGDEDEDGLDNVLEAFLGSDPLKEDTDGDGFTDYEEFVAGYSVLMDSDGEITATDLEIYQARFLERYNYVGDVLIFYYLERSLALFKAGGNKVGLQEFAKAIELEKSEPVFTGHLARLNEEGNFAGSRDVAQFYTGIYPSSAKAYVAYGAANLSLGLFAEAITEFNIAIKMGSTDPDVLAGLVEAKASLEDGGEVEVEAGL